MVALKDFMVCVATNLGFIVHKSCVQGLIDRGKADRCLLIAFCYLFKDRL